MANSSEIWAPCLLIQAPCRHGLQTGSSCSKSFENAKIIGLFQTNLNWLNSKRISRTICLLEWAPACLQGFPWWDANVPTLNYVDISTIANISIQTTTNIKTFPWWEDNGLVLNCDDISTIKNVFLFMFYTKYKQPMTL